MEIIESTQAELIRTKDRILALLQATPDERLLWKPSPQARSIVEIVAHSANSLANIAMQLRGVPFAVPTSAEANVGFLEHDALFTSRDQVGNYLQEKCDEYVALLGTFTQEDLGRLVALPFGLGQAPIGFFMTLGNVHTIGHIC